MIGSNRPIARDTARSVEPGGTPKLARSPRRTRMNWRHRTAVEQRPGWGAALNAVAFISQLCPSSPKGAPQARTTHSFCVAWPAAQAICWQTATQISERRWALMAKRTRRAGTTAGAAEVMQLPAVCPRPLASRCRSWRTIRAHEGRRRLGLPAAASPQGRSPWAPSQSAVPWSFSRSSGSSSSLATRRVTPSSRPEWAAL